MNAVASLSMYYRPETAAANNRFWSLVRDQLREAGVDAPEILTVNGLGDAFWRDPGLVLSQTCGYPYRIGLVDAVHLVGTPDYGLEGCAPGFYRSVFLVRRDSRFQTLSDLDGVAFAFNDESSQSGFQGPLDFADINGVSLSPTHKTGGHLASAELVAQGVADAAALDAVTWRDCVRYDEWSQELRTVAVTHSVPGLPLICAKEIAPDVVRNAIEKALDKLDLEHRSTLGINGIVRMSSGDYSAEAFQPCGPDAD